MSAQAEPASWRTIVAAAQAHREKTLAALHPPLPDLPLHHLPLDVTSIPSRVLAPEECQITQTSPEDLVNLLATGKLSSVAVTAAFLRRAALAQKLVNCLTELLPDIALQRARDLDEYFKHHGEPIGPLHGLPISVKEHVNIKNHDVNGAFCSGWGNIADDDAHILKILWNAGCVLYCRTTEPQTTMHLETASNLYGTTVNPFNRNLTAGGSSGGEGALLGLRGSCLGIGTDIGGSIRSPAANNGLYGLRPTTYRLPLGDVTLAMEGMEQILCVIGPLSTSLEGIKMFMKVLIDAKPWLIEPSLVPIPWTISAPHLGPRLKVAVMWDDGVVRPHPPIIRALKETVAKLQKDSDIEIVEWKPYKHDLAWDIIASLYFADGGKAENECIDSTGEPWLPLSRWILTDNKNVKRLSIEQVWEQTWKREQYRTDYAKHWMATATGTSKSGEPTGTVDVILCPVGPGAAPPLECSKYWGYTSQWNLLDYPALVFPVGIVDQALDPKDDNYQPRNEDDKFNHKLYSPERYTNAPVSLQLVGRRYEDEKVIQALEMMQRSL